MAERFIPKAQEIYRHFKGELYQVIAVAEHTETREQLVIYQALYGDFGIYARPLEMFVSPVDRAKYPDALQEFRFQLQGPEAGRQQAGSRGESMASVGEAQEITQREQGISSDAVKGRQTVCKDALTSKTPYPENQAAVARLGSKNQAATAMYAPENQAATAMYAPENQAVTVESEPEEPGLDPLVLEFLDARTYEQRLNVLAALHHRITNEMITTMSLCCDIEVEGDDVEQRYEDLKQCLITKERFEIKRLM